MSAIENCILVIFLYKTKTATDRLVVTELVPIFKATISNCDCATVATHGSVT